MAGSLKYKVHYQHPDGRKVGDVMPFYNSGVYHIFYLLNGSGHDDINHEHAFSSDLIHWTTVAPSITHEDNCAFTGSYLKTLDGLFHCFFTRWNPDNVLGRETIGHAVSTNLIDWKKSNLHLVPDGTIYSDAQYRDFRDPCVFFDNTDKYFHMLLLANPKNKKNNEKSWDENWIQGHYRSKNLVDWEHLFPIPGNFADECPDYIYHSGHHYIHGCHRYAIGETQWGPYHTEEDFVLDKGLRAAKTCHVGDRIMWFGGFIDGSITLAREVVFLPSGRLGLCLAAEMYVASNKLISESIDKNKTILIDKDKAQRIAISSLNRASLTIDFEAIKFELFEGVFSFINLENRTILDGRFFFESATDQIDIIIDLDLIEVYWSGKGAFTFCAKKEISKLSIVAGIETIISIFSF